MLSNIFWIAGGAMLALWLLHCLCLRLEKAGYLYYRRRGRGSAAGVLNEIDRMVRPSIEHVVRIEDEIAADQDDVGGD